MAITRFVAKVVLLDIEDHFLLLTRSDTHPTLAGFYDLPGGIVEELEEPGAALLREIQEEVGLTLELSKLQVMYAVTMMINGKSWPTLLYVGRVDQQKPDAALSYEHKAYEWAPLNRLREVEPHLAPTYREALDYILTNDIIHDIVEA